MKSVDLDPLEPRQWKYMKNILPALLLGLALLPACKKTVPQNVVVDEMTTAMRVYAPKTVTGMCGVKTRGMTTVAISNVRLNEKDQTRGVAHIKGKPMFSPGVTLPNECEGDVEFSFNSSTSTTKKGKVRKSKTTWSLAHIKLVSVQTPGVGVANVEEDPEDNDGV